VGKVFPPLGFTKPSPTVFPINCSSVTAQKFHIPTAHWVAHDNLPGLGCCLHTTPLASDSVDKGGSFSVGIAFSKRDNATD
jgi:hypothetical protein